MQQSKLEKSDSQDYRAARQRNYRYGLSTGRVKRQRRFLALNPLMPVRRYFSFWTVFGALGLALLAWFLWSPEVVRGPATKSGSGIADLGVVYISSSVELNNSSVSSGATGLVVTGVKPTSAAGRAGLQPGDLIIRLEGRSIPPDESLLNLLSAYRPGDTVKLDVLRNTRPLHFTVVLD